MRAGTTQQTNPQKMVGRPLSCGNSTVRTLALGSLLCAVHTCALAQGPLKFEAEDVTGPEDAWEVDKYSETKWNLWSTDKDAEKKWSEGIVLQSPRVMADREKPEDGAPPLHTVIKDLTPGKYYVSIGGVGRPMGISLDGKTWRKIDGGSRNLGLIDIPTGTFELWVDDRYAAETGAGSCYYDYLELTPLPDPNRKPKVTGWAKERVREKLDRGVVALPTGEGIYVGWRLLEADPADIAFNVYRRTGRHQPTKLNAEPISATTDFVDTSPVGEVRNDYFVKPVVAGKEGPGSVTASATPGEARNYVSIKLDGDHTFQKTGIADLNGDGAYDYVLKQPNANIDPYVKYWQRSPETYKLEAYLADGTFLWRYDLGWDIERGIWYSPYVVHDLDGDGKAEVCLKGGEPGADHRDEDGRVQSGPEYLLILDGMTGKVRAKADWPAREDFPGYNYASRNQMCIAYLDGKTPCILVERGTYNVIEFRAYQFREGELTELWRWSDSEEGGRYRGQGAHCLSVADIDGDGRDEISLGSAMLDDNGCGLWSTGMGHPDHHYLGDIDPTHPGLEIYYGMETRQQRNGCCLVDAKTGEILWGLDGPTRHVHSSGMCADIDPTHPGRECYSSDTDAEKRSERRWLFDVKGNVLTDELNWGFGLRTLYWDADLQSELVRGRNIFKYRGGEYANAFEGSISAIADVLGDWREELITSVAGQLRIYSTTLPAADRRVCLMQDPHYRMDVVVQAMGYTKPPMATECLSAGKASVALVVPETKLQPGEATPAEVVVAASAAEGVKGAVELQADGIVSISAAKIAVEVKPGEVKRYPFTVTADHGPTLLGRGASAEVSMQFEGTGRTQSSRMALRVADCVRTWLPRTQGEDFCAQGGGEVHLRDDKVGADGKCFSHWDDAGHWLEWKVNAPEEGSYYVVARYCTPAAVIRQVALDGDPLCGCPPKFAATGGFSADANDWAHAAPVGPCGKPHAVPLGAGEHTLRMTNLDGQGMNVDYVMLVPAGM